MPLVPDDVLVPSLPTRLRTPADVQRMVTALWLADGLFHFEDDPEDMRDHSVSGAPLIFGPDAVERLRSLQDDLADHDLYDYAFLMAGYLSQVPPYPETAEDWRMMAEMGVLPPR